MAHKSSPMNGLKMVALIEGDCAAAIGVDLEIERRPAALFRASGHGREQGRSGSAAPPCRENINFIQPATRASVFESQDAGAIGDADRLRS